MRRPHRNRRAGLASLLMIMTLAHLQGCGDTAPWTANTAPGAKADQRHAASATSATITQIVSRYLDRGFIHVHEPGGRTFYSFTPLETAQADVTGDGRVDYQDREGPAWYQQVRNHGHESVVAIALADLGRCDEAKGILRAHWYRQNDDGSDAYTVRPDHQPYPYLGDGLITPPLLAYHALQIHQRCGADVSFLEQAWFYGSRNTGWWERPGNDRRDDDRCEGMYLWKDPVESVRDSWVGTVDNTRLAAWVETGGPAGQCSPDLTAMIVAQYRALARIGRSLATAKGEPQLGVYGDEYAARAERLAGVMNRLMWDEGDAIYYGVRRDDGAKVRVKDLGSLLPLFAGVPDADRARRIVARHLWPQDGAFHADAGLPSLGRDHPRYGADNHWNGGTWPAYTLLVVAGLTGYGALERLEAQRIASGLANQLAAHPDGPFPEWYDSERGWQPGPHNTGYITTAAVLPMARLAGL